MCFSMRSQFHNYYYPSGVYTKKKNACEIPILTPQPIQMFVSLDTKEMCLGTMVLGHLPMPSDPLEYRCAIPLSISTPTTPSTSSTFIPTPHSGHLTEHPLATLLSTQCCTHSLHTRGAWTHSALSGWAGNADGCSTSLQTTQARS